MDVTADTLLARSELHDLALPRDARLEAAMMARARAGEEAAFRWLLEQYRARAVRLAAHVLQSGDAEDAAQEAFVLPRPPAQYDPGFWWRRSGKKKVALPASRRQSGSSLSLPALCRVTEGFFIAFSLTGRNGLGEETT